MPGTLVIAAVCARPFVQAAAAAGYAVIALDAFADEDTRRAAQQAHRIAYANGGFDAQHFLQVLRGLDLGPAAGLVYGSGFEAAPELLEQAAKHVAVIGNTPAVLRRLKDPQQFFPLLRELGIAHPEVSMEPPLQMQGWLRKQGGGSGGTHISSALEKRQEAAGRHYYQREVPGLPVSLLFAADGRKARAAGFNEQWVAPATGMPCRYGGAVSRAELAQHVQQQLIDAAERLVSATGLCGFNSLDAIAYENGVHMLEINPRLSATFELYSDGTGALFNLHLQACAGDMTSWPQWPQQAKAQHIVYAPQALRIPPAFAWPAWAADLPPSGQVVEAGHPLCSVLAQAADAAQAKALVRTRGQAVLAMVAGKG